MVILKAKFSSNDKMFLIFFRLVVVYEKTEIQLKRKIYNRIPTECRIKNLAAMTRVINGDNDKYERGERKGSIIMDRVCHWYIMSIRHK